MYISKGHQHQGDDMDANTAKVHGYLAEKNKRMAEKAEAIGATETAADLRALQQGMLEDLLEEAIIENQLRDL
jgi:hypothetical protein